MVKCCIQRSSDCFQFKQQVPNCVRRWQQAIRNAEEWVCCQKIFCCIVQFRRGRRISCFKENNKKHAVQQAHWQWLFSAISSTWENKFSCSTWPFFGLSPQHNKNWDVQQYDQHHWYVEKNYDRKHGCEPEKDFERANKNHCPFSPKTEKIISRKLSRFTSPKRHWTTSARTCKHHPLWCKSWSQIGNNYRKDQPPN